MNNGSALLTISQLAAHAGVTVRAVRHYHSTGLLTEPERDHSGYRRYDAAAVVRVIKIRTLAEAGVPLSRIDELLAADEDSFARAIEEIDRRLRDEILQLQRHRRRVSELATGDRLALPPEACSYLDRLRELGIPPRAIEMERDAWILVAAQIPEQMPALMALKQAQVTNPSVIALYTELVEAVEWRPDDPRIAAIADRLVALIEEGTGERTTPPAQSPDASPTDDPDQEFPLDDRLVALLDDVFVRSVPIAPVLLHLLEERGWTGWTNLQRIAPDP